MRKAAWLLIGSFLASVALFGFVETTPVAAAAIVVPRPPRPPRAPRGIIATAILTASAAPAAAGATGKAVFKVNAVAGVKTLEVDVTVPALANAALVASVDGTALGALPLNPLAAGSVTFAAAALPGRVVSAAVAAARAGSLITVTTDTGVLLLSGRLK